MRGINYTIALKLREIRYIHAEGCPVSEMKYDLSAILNLLVLVASTAVPGTVFDKVLGGNAEVAIARDAQLICVAP